VKVPTFKGTLSEVYLENLVPSFYIDQTEGWTEIQAQQIGRYQQLEIKEIAIEYLLGAVDAINARVAERQSLQQQAAQREAARAIAERVNHLADWRDWSIEWSGNGSISDIIKRWSAQRLREAFKKDANVDLPQTISFLSQRITRLRESLAKDGVDRHNTSAPTEFSQKAIALKQRRHALNESLSTLRIQKEQTDELLSSLEHRIQSASDLLRFKNTGIGRLDHVECPTCHRDLDPITFALTNQSAQSVSVHIESLKRDREMMATNGHSIDTGIRTTRASLQAVDVEFREAERALMSVTAAAGAEREQIAKIVAELASLERQIDRAREAMAEMDEIQADIDRWIAEARSFDAPPASSVDLSERKAAFLDALRKYLIELQHSEVNAASAGSLSFDELYVPYLDTRRLRSLGSASDHSRLTMAYALGLAAAGTRPTGLHPGLVLLDEPLQQNPDPKHRTRFMQFLGKDLARTAMFQTIIFTSLRTDEVTRLRKEGVSVQTPTGKKWLQLLPVPEHPIENQEEARS
jgi:DNA repair exonuclease SbcCD ATPase subunit